MQSVILFLAVVGSAYAGIPMYILPEMVVTAQMDTSISYLLPEIVVTAERPSSNAAIKTEKGDRNPLDFRNALIRPLQGLPMPIKFADAEPIDMKVITAAQTFHGDYVVEKNDTVDDDVTVMGGNADIQGYIDGDLAVLGGTVKMAGTVDGDVAVMGGALDLFGEIAGDAAVFGGAITNKGKIGGDIFVMGGTIELDSGSVVEGDIASIGAQVEKDSNAIVMGSTSTVQMDALRKYMPRIAKLSRLRPQLGIISAIVRRIIGLVVIAVFYLLCLLSLLIFPAAIEKINIKLRDEFWISLAIGVAVLIAIIPAIVLFAISIVGIPLILLLPIALVVAGIFGFASLSSVVGKRICESAKWKIESHIGVFTIGWLALMAICIIAALVQFPLFGILGITIVWIAWTIGQGAATYAIFKKV